MLYLSVKEAKKGDENGDGKGTLPANNLLAANMHPLRRQSWWLTPRKKQSETHQNRV